MTIRAIDLFAGAGGSTTGMAAAGWRVVWAANHWPLAVEVHRRNHPETCHSTQDLQQADFRDVPAHEVLWGSPACQGHSPAASGGGRYTRRGTAPHHDYLRSTAWAVITAAEVCRPALCVVENVEAFRKWTLWPAWIQAWQALGYAVSTQVLDATDFGVPQKRPRLFVVAVRGSRPFALGYPAHDAFPRRRLADVVNLDAGEWQPLTQAAPGVQRRVARAIARHGFGGAFHTQSVRDNAGRSLDRPAPAVTTKHQHGLVRGTGAWQQREYRPLRLDEYQALMGFPADYKLEGAGVSTGVLLLGNAVCPPVARWISQRVTSLL